MFFWGDWTAINTCPKQADINLILKTSKVDRKIFQPKRIISDACGFQMGFDILFIFVFCDLIHWEFQVFSSWQKYFP